MLKKIAISTIFAFVFASIISCNKKELVLNQDDPLSMKPGIQWAVVTSPYTAFFVEPDYSSDVLSYGRAGLVAMVKGSHIVKVSKSNKVNTVMYWYNFEQGWLPQDVLELFDNKLRAENYARQLKSN